MNKNEKYSKSEVGHVINVGNLHKLNELIQTFGAKYNPKPSVLTLVHLRKRYTDCDTHIGIVHNKTKLDNAAINDRQNAFDAADILATSVFNAFAAVAEDDKDIEDLQRYIDKLRGEPATPQTNEDEEGQEIKETRSSSQQSFINRADHFRAIVEHVEGFPNYDPNEEELKVPALKAVLADLFEHNSITAITEAELQKAQTDRDVALYDPKEGMYKITQRVKHYIKSLYGSTSEQYAKARAIKFTKPRKKRKKKS